jgi:tryptophan halogenase
MDKIDTMIVLGGGTSGMITALMMKTQYPDKDIRVIESSAVGIIGVGEGATEHWHHFCDFIGIPLEETLAECGATLKAGIKFSNWGVPDYYHATCEPYSQAAGDYLAVYALMISQGASPIDIIFDRRCVNNEIPVGWLEGTAACPVNQFHFNTFSTNDYLHKLCKNRNIPVIDDKITDVELTDDGYIKTLHGGNDSYSADFFIDCSGFSKLLISKLGAKWVSYKDHLWLNSAIAFPTEDTDEYPVCTQATALDYGWMWNTPVRGRWGNGYVFCDKYIDFDQAQAEVERVLGKKVNIAKKIKFEAGKLDKAWIKNCASIGLCSSFVEPLESSAISQTVLQAFLITNLLPCWLNNNEEIAEIYNDKCDNLCENILDFIAVHYVSPREDTAFWRDLKDNREQWMPQSLKTKLAKWEKRLPMVVDFNKQYSLFAASNWIVTLHGMQLIKRENVEREVSMLSPYIKIRSQEIIDVNKKLEQELVHMPHKKILELFLEKYKEHMEKIQGFQNVHQ